MAAVFRRARQLLHPAGRIVVMFNHKETWAWRSLGMALIRAGFEIRSSVPIYTEARVKPEYPRPGCRPQHGAPPVPAA